MILTVPEFIEACQHRSKVPRVGASQAIEEFLDRDATGPRLVKLYAKLHSSSTSILMLIHPGLAPPCALLIGRTTAVCQATTMGAVKSDLWFKIRDLMSKCQSSP